MLQNQTDRERFKVFAGQYRKRLAEGMATVYGGQASDAVKLSGDEELSEYRRPTSPVALDVLGRGGTIEDAERANAMYAEYLKGQQAAAKASGWTAEQLREANLDDDGIFKTCRAQAWEMARANGHGDPTKTVKYHEDMAKRLAEFRARTAQPAGMEAI